jgi:hypothetical protein
VSEEALRLTEIDISRFYDWNVAMMTFYDYLEQFMQMGLVFENDRVREQLKRPEKKTNEFADQISPKNQGKAVELAQEMEKRGKSIDDKKDQYATGGSSGSFYDSFLEILGVTKATIDGGEGVKKALDLNHQETAMLIEKIERRCLDLAMHLAMRFLTDATVQREIAYLVVAVARKQSGVVDYDSRLLRKYYRVESRSQSDFKRAIDEIIKECPNTAAKLNFDLVIRQYTPDGVEIVPEHMIRELQFNDKYVQDNILKMPKYQQKMMMAMQPNPQMFPPQPMPGPNHPGMMPPQQGMPMQGMPPQGIPMQGMPPQGIPPQQGIFQSMPPQFPPQGRPANVMNPMMFVQGPPQQRPQQPPLPQNLQNRGSSIDINKVGELHTSNIPNLSQSMKTP